MTHERPREYVLGTGSDELGRLGLQHRLWGDAAHGAWRLAGMRPGMRVLDVGCGPGYAALDMAQLVVVKEQHPGAGATWTGSVTGVDESEPFIAHLNNQAASRDLGAACSGVVGDVQNLASALPGAAGSFDLAYARWVLCFVKDPGAVVEGVASMLARGGRFVVHDYFNYESMALAPRRESDRRAIAATARSWRDRGGDPDVVARLPRLLEGAGLRVVHLSVHQRLARPHESMWQWPWVWWHNYTPKLVQMGYLTQADQDEFFADMAAAAADPGSFWLCPPVFEVIAEKS